ncbi:MAG: hypothetical protein V1903_02360 [Bacteroidota bacterium]
MVTRGTKVIIAITFSVSSAAIIFAFFYYRSINRSEDPRIETARRLLTEFEKIPAETEGIEAFHYLDSAFSIFSRLPDYRFSFEAGVIYNNKCSALLMKAIYDSTISLHEKQALLDLSSGYCDSSIMVYRRWIREWETLSAGEIHRKIIPFMDKNDQAFSGYNIDRIVNRRIKNIILAQIETPRRLSVSLTNKGTIFRHLSMPDSALHYYNFALSIWKDNRTAESNRSVLMGGDPLKPGLIESLFPPDKNKN